MTTALVFACVLIPFVTLTGRRLRQARKEIDWLRRRLGGEGSSTLVRAEVAHILRQKAIRLARSGSIEQVKQNLDCADEIERSGYNKI